MPSSQLIGKAKELHVAAQLVAAGYYVYFPLVDNGFDLVVTDEQGKRFVPVQVKYKAERTGIMLKKKDVARFEGTNVVLVFGKAAKAVGTNAIFWFIPFDKWQDKAKDYGRRDDMMVVRFDGNLEWLAEFEGKKGIEKSFKFLGKR